MSAITNPLFYTTKTQGGKSSVVNIDHVMAIDKHDIDTSVATNQKPTYKIVFLIAGHNNNVKEIVWLYNSEAERDEDYAVILDEVGTDIGVLS
jgi:hypothetical protein